MKYFAPLLAAILLSQGCVFATTFTVDDKNKLQETANNLQPGDTLILGAGYWTDIQIDLPQSGTENAPITLKAPSPGETILQGTTHIGIGGDHVIVSGIHFKNAFPPQQTSSTPLQKANEDVNAIIDFMTDPDHYASESRITNCYFENCNPTEPRRYHWVRLWGLHNRVDHCRFEGQDHKGVTVQVRLHLPDAAHIIDHNYFLNRKPGDGNGYECIQAGQSWASMLRGEIRIEKNIFENCDGETEIISSKTCDNLIKNNLFLRSAGTLTIRHGDRTTAQDNLFIGDGKPNAGGIRVIGNDHKVIGNYFHGVNSYTGGVIVLYNGIPDGPINGYIAANNAQINNNLIIHCNGNPIYLNGGYGSRNRVSQPSNVSLKGNVIVHPPNFGNVTLAGHLDDLKAENNVFSGGELGFRENSGFTRTKLTLKQQPDGLLSINDNSVNPNKRHQPPALPQVSKVGISWMHTSINLN